MMIRYGKPFLKYICEKQKRKKKSIRRGKGRPIRGRVWASNKKGKNFVYLQPENHYHHHENQGAAGDGRRRAEEPPW
jgi:hypothetical protein